MFLLFCDQKSSRKVPLLPRRGARLRGCSPLRTPQRKKIDPSGAKMVGRGWLPLRGAPAGRRVRGGPRSTNLTPTTPQSPSVTAPLKGSQIGRRGRRCGVAQRSMPQWGIEPHERASFARWRPSFWPPSADAPWRYAWLRMIARADMESAPTATAKPPLCKGRWHGVSRDGGIVVLRG